MPSSKTLYIINDALTEVFQRLELRESLGLGEEDDVDDLIDEATHAVSHVWWPDEDAVMEV